MKQQQPKKLQETRSSKGMDRICGTYGSIWTTQLSHEQILTDGTLWSLSSFLSACKGVGSSFSTPGEATNGSPSLDRRHPSACPQIRRGIEQLFSDLLRFSHRGPMFREQHLLPSHYSIPAQQTQDPHPPAWKTPPITQLVALSRSGSMFTGFVLQPSIHQTHPLHLPNSTFYTLKPERLLKQSANHSPASKASISLPDFKIRSKLPGSKYNALPDLLSPSFQLCPAISSSFSRP